MNKEEIRVLLRKGLVKEPQVMEQISMKRKFKVESAEELRRLRTFGTLSDYWTRKSNLLCALALFGLKFGPHVNKFMVPFFMHVRAALVNYLSK